MYSDKDIAGAVEAGALSEEAAGAFRSHVAAASGLSINDREHQRYFSGYYEVFSMSASIILALGVGVLLGTSSLIAGGLGFVAMLWLASELFVRKQGSTYCAIWFNAMMWLGGTVALLAMFNGEEVIKNPQFAMMMGEVEPKSFINTVGGSQLLLAGLFGLYFWRFKQAIAGYMTVALIVLGLLALFLGANYPDVMSGKAILYLMLILALVVMALSLYLDSTDKTRTGLASETATWLHALAAALLAPSLFGLMGMSFGELDNFSGGAGIAAVTILLFGLLVLLSIIFNRRAYAGASVIYPIIGITALLAEGEPNAKLLAGSAIIVGGALVALAYFWSPIRAAIVSKLPAGLQAKLPAYAGQALTADEFE